MKKMLAILMAAAMLLALCACGSAAPAATESAPAASAAEAPAAEAPAEEAAGEAAADSDLAYIQGKGTLVVGITDFAPMDYKEGNEWKSKSTWVKCTAWGNLATALSRMSFAQGDRVMVEGELRNNNWVNQQTHEQHSEMYVIVTEMRKMARPKSSGNAGGASAQAKEQGGQTQKPKPEYQQAYEAQMQQDMNDLPF